MRIAVLTLLIILSGCSPMPNKAQLFPDVRPGSAIEQMNNEVYRPIQKYSFKDQNPFTGWNKFWIGAAIVGQTGDAVSTINALDGGKCREGNPLVGSNPSAGYIVVLKVLTTGFVVLMAEYMLDGDQKQQTYRNWLYGTLAIAGLGATAWNSSLECD